MSKKEAILGRKNGRRVASILSPKFNTVLKITAEYRENHALLIGNKKNVLHALRSTESCSELMASKKHKLNWLQKIKGSNFFFRFCLNLFI